MQERSCKVKYNKVARYIERNEGNIGLRPDTFNTSRCHNNMYNGINKGRFMIQHRCDDVKVYKY